MTFQKKIPSIAMDTQESETTPVTTSTETKTSIVMQTETKSESDDSVKITKSEFETLMRRLNAIEKEDQTVTSQSAFKRYSGPRSYSFKMLEGKPIVHLVMTRNVVKKNLSAGNGAFIEDQRIMVTYADKTEEEMMYDDFSQQFVWSEKYIPVSEKHSKKVYFKDSTRKPEIVDEGFFKTHFMTITESGQPIVNHDIVKKADNIDYYTFRIDELDEDGKKIIFGGKEFTVDHTAIN